MDTRSSSFRALLSALAIHLALLVFIWISIYPFTHKKPNPKERPLTLSIQSVRLTASGDDLLKSDASAPSVPEPIQSSLLDAPQKMDSILAKSEEIPPVQSPINPIVPTGKTADLIKRHYGELFDDLSGGEQEFIIHNLQKIRRINHPIGNALLATKPQHLLRDRDNNYVEFYLHPDGTVTDITLVNEKSNPVLDELIIETIQNAYSKYPRPKQTTFIRLRSWVIQVQIEEFD